MEEAWQKRSSKTFLKGWSGEGHEQHLSQLHQAATPERDSSAEINAGRTQRRTDDTPEPGTVCQGRG